MFKKLIPLVLMVFMSACANTQTTSNADTGMKMPCCEKCECCKSAKCGECCKDGSCKMCMKGNMSPMKEGEKCPMCAKATREGKAKQSKIKP